MGGIVSKIFGKGYKINDQANRETSQEKADAPEENRHAKQEPPGQSDSSTKDEVPHSAQEVKQATTQLSNEPPSEAAKQEPEPAEVTQTPSPVETPAPEPPKSSPAAAPVIEPQIIDLPKPPELKEKEPVTETFVTSSTELKQESVPPKEPELTPTETPAPVSQVEESKPPPVNEPEISPVQTSKPLLSQKPETQQVAETLVTSTTETEKEQSLVDQPNEQELIPDKAPEPISQVQELQPEQDSLLITSVSEPSNEPSLEVPANKPELSLSEELAQLLSSPVKEETQIPPLPLSEPPKDELQQPVSPVLEENIQQDAIQEVRTAVYTIQGSVPPETIMDVPIPVAEPVLQSQVVSDEVAHPPEPVKNKIQEPLPPVSEPVLEPLPPVNEPVQEPLPPVTEPVQEPLPSVSKPVQEPLPPVSEPVQEPLPPVSEPVQEPLPPVSEPVQEPLPPVSEPVQEPLSPVSEPVQEPTLDAVVSSEKSAVQVEIVTVSNPPVELVAVEPEPVQKAPESLPPVEPPSLQDQPTSFELIDEILAKEIQETQDLSSFSFIQASELEQPASLQQHTEAPASDLLSFVNLETPPPSPVNEISQAVEPDQSTSQVVAEENKEEKDIEGAAIKIQAGIRGYLTRKTLQEAKQVEKGAALTEEKDASTQPSEASPQETNSEPQVPETTTQQLPVYIAVCPPCPEPQAQEPDSTEQSQERLPQQSEATAQSPVVVSTAEVTLSNQISRTETSSKAILDEQPTSQQNPTEVTSSESDTTAESAAIRIQSTYRGYAVRKQMKEQNETSAPEGDDSEVEVIGEGSLDVTTNYRTGEGLEESISASEDFQEDDEERNPEAAATKIQAAFRGYRVRRELKPDNGPSVHAKESDSKVNPLEENNVHDGLQASGQLVSRVEAN